METKTLGELADFVGGKVFGDPDIKINSVATLALAKEGDISFLTNTKYTNQLQSTKASAVVVGTEIEAPTALLVSENPHYAFCQIVVLLHGHRRHKETTLISQVSIANTAQIGDVCQIHRFVTISDKAKIGDRCILYPGVFIGDEVVVGDDCILYPNVVIYDKCQIGSSVIIQANSTVGEDGFGFATHNGQHHKIPHIGRVVIEDNVEIGSNCGIERGTLEDTVIGKGSKIGDLVTIGHGTKIGPHSFLVAQVGIAGSAVLGHHCVVGGQAGIVGHIKIGDMVSIAAQAGVINDVPDGTGILGAPAIDASKGKRAYSLIENLPEMHKSIRRIQKSLKELEKPKKS